MANTQNPEEAAIIGTSDVEQPAAAPAAPEATEPAAAPAAPEATEPAAAPAAPEATEPVEAPAAPELAGKTPDEIILALQQIGAEEDRMSRSKEVEGIKAAFYRVLGKLKAEAQEAGEDVAAKFDEVEFRFKRIYADYKRERAEYNKQQDAQREANLEVKKAIIEELKALVDGGEDVGAAFPALRELQNRWREAGPVPATAFRDINDTYQFYVEKFYDMVKINHDLRDLDFKKNLEAKEALCAAAEKLAENENVVAAFNELQKLHEQWKELGPVAKEFRDSIWDRFKASTAEINKLYQAHFEGLKAEQAANLEAKSALCDEVEAIASKEDIKDSGEWNALSKQIEDIQARWRAIGFATRKDNQKIYDRFRAACDKFFERKREYYNTIKEDLNGNVARKMAIIEEAEALKASTEWKKASDRFIAMQKEWKEIGAVPRKKSEQLWKRFRAACDEFFAERDKNAKPENDFYGNLRAKKAIIAEIQAYEPKDPETDAKAALEFAERYKAIGFVPFKEKDAVNAAYREAIDAKFPRAPRQNTRGARPARQLSPREELMRKYNALQQDITTYENNIGFFSNSRNSQPLIAQMQERIAAAKAELKDLQEQIRAIMNEEQEEK